MPTNDKPSDRSPHPDLPEWDRTHRWVLNCYESDRAELTVVFDEARPSLRELIALRRCLPDFCNSPPAAVRDRVRTTGRLELGELSGPEARRLLTQLEKENIRAELRNTSSISYLPEDQTLGLALLIEDEDISRRLAEEMIRAGVPVKHVVE